MICHQDPETFPKHTDSATTSLVVYIKIINSTVSLLLNSTLITTQSAIEHHKYWLLINMAKGLGYQDNTTKSLVWLDSRTFSAHHDLLVAKYFPDALPIVPTSPLNAAVQNCLPDKTFAGFMLCMVLLVWSCFNCVAQCKISWHHHYTEDRCLSAFVFCLTDSIALEIFNNFVIDETINETRPEALKGWTPEPPAE